jgi:tetratricopeptide (TPR) repeat protein
MIPWTVWWVLLSWLSAGLGAPPENYYNAANRLFAAGQFQGAESLYARVWQAPSPGRAWLRGEAAPVLKFKSLYNAGNAAYRQGHWDAAIRDYEGALRLDPSDEDAWNNLDLAQAHLRGPAGVSAAGPPAAIGENQRGETAVTADIFSLPPAALADYIQALTRAGYPFRPGSSLKPAEPSAGDDEVDW